jgi:hypothetical protein
MQHFPTPAHGHNVQQIFFFKTFFKSNEHPSPVGCIKSMWTFHRHEKALPHQAVNPKKKKKKLNYYTRTRYYVTKILLSTFTIT